MSGVAPPPGAVRAPATGRWADDRLSPVDPGPRSSSADVRAVLAATAGARLLRRQQRRDKAVLLGVDLVTVLVAVWLGRLAGGGEPAAGIAVLLVPLWLICLAARGTYDAHAVGSGTTEIGEVLEASATAGLAVVLVAYLAGAQDARAFVLVALPAGTGALLLGRFAVRAALGRTRRRGGGRQVLAIGTVRDVLHLVEQAGRSPGAGFRVTGACVPRYDGPQRRQPHGRRASRTGAAHQQRNGDRRADPDRRGDVDELTAAGVPVLGTPREVLTALRNGGADTVVVTGHGALSRHALRRLAWQLEGTAVRLYVASALSDVAMPRITLQALGGMSLLHVEAPTLGGASLVLKATLDRLAAALLLLLLGPVLLVLGLAIRLSSPGPALYRQERVGLGGRPFHCLKLRTMRQDADREVGAADGSAGNEVLFKLRVDPRVTTVGRRLRRYSLDELPQLLNVLGGSMSLVGPRPPLPAEVAAYGDDVRRRLFVKPGMTGLWQVSGRSDLTWAESVRLDLYYVENWSLRLDLSLITRTVAAVLRSRGAY